MELYSSHTSFASFQHPCPFPGVILRRRYPFSCSKRETRPTRASVSSCWIGNQAQAVWSFEKPPDVATSLIDPCYPGGRGAVSPGRSLYRYLNRPQAKTSALPLLTPVYPLEGLSLGGLYPNYYMSRFRGVKMSGPIRTNLRAQGPIRRAPLEELGRVGMLPALVHLA